MECYFMYDEGYNYDEKARLLLGVGFKKEMFAGVSPQYVRDQTIINLTDSKRGTMQFQQHSDAPSKEELSGLIKILKPDRVIDAGFNDIDLDKFYEKFR